MSTTASATTPEASGTFRRALLLMTATSFLIPAVGVVTAPILARALSTDGRGELAAALAPAGLMLAVATLGLPDALTFHLAKRPSLTRHALAWSSAVTLVLGLLCLLATWLALPFLSAGDTGLGDLILLATAMTVPALLANVFRGAAMGRQLWGAVAVERLVITGIKLIGLAAFFVIGGLTVYVAVLVNVVAPIVAGFAYWRLLRRPPKPPAVDGAAQSGTLAALLSFGSKVWFGSVASMLLSRFGQLFMAPLSSVADLGVYVVASTISDVPLMVALAIQGALYGANSKSTDSNQLTTTTRVTLLLGVGGCTVLGVTLPWWIGLLFGTEFEVATVPAVMLLVSAVICIPGLMAASGVAAWGRPGLRSIGLATTLVVNVTSFLILVPVFGVYGACWTSIFSNMAMTGFMVLAASRVMGAPVTSFVVPRRSDVRLVLGETRRLLQRLSRRPRTAPEQPDDDVATEVGDPGSEQAQGR